MSSPREWAAEKANVDSSLPVQMLLAVQLTVKISDGDYLECYQHPNGQQIVIVGYQLHGIASRLE